MRRIILCFLCLFICCSTTFSQYGLSVLQDNGLTWLKDSVNYVGEFKNGYARVEWKDRTQNFINRAGRRIYPEGSVTAYSQESGTFPFPYFVFTGKDYKKGLLDTAGKIVVPAVYRNLEFKNRYVIVSNDKYGIWDEQLQPVLAVEYDYADAATATDSLIVMTHYVPDVKKNQLALYNVLAKKLVIPFDFYENILNAQWSYIVWKDNNPALYSLAGTQLIPFGKYRKLMPDFKNKMVHGIKGDEHNVMDSLGNVIIPGGLYDDLHAYTSDADLFVTKKNGRWGAINIANKVVVPFEYDELEGFAGDGVSRARKNGEIFFISKKGYPLGERKNRPEDGYALYKHKDTLGYVDQSGQVFPFPDYKWMDKYTKKGIVVCTRNMKWGLMNGELKLVADTVYDNIKTAYNGYFIVMKGYKFGVMDGQGKLHIPFMYNSIQTKMGTNFEVTEGAKTEIITLKKIE